MKTLHLTHDDGEPIMNIHIDNDATRTESTLVILGDDYDQEPQPIFARPDHLG